MHHRTVKVKAKSVDATDNVNHPDLSIVALFFKYKAHCPHIDHPDAFYLCPLSEPRNAVWYARQPLGINKLASTVRRICTAGGFVGHRTNHSLRATAASRLYDSTAKYTLIESMK